MLKRVSFAYAMPTANASFLEIQSSLFCSLPLKLKESVRSENALQTRKRHNYLKVLFKISCK